ncbi:MAG: HD domain-containing phosphohydrolase, partial [bacterium]
LCDWANGLPRWAGLAWVPAGPIERPQPGAGDALLVQLDGRNGLLPLGFVLAEVKESGLDAPRAADLARWGSLARLALETRWDENRSRRSLEQLHEEKEQLAELHRTKSQFIAAVSHELRTPLTSITAYAETLRARNITIEDAVRDKFLRVIHDEGRRLTRIVDDILDLATMDVGRVRLSCRAVDVRAVIEDALDVIRPIADERNISVACVNPQSVEVHADPDLLKQLLVNLLDNAVKFSDDRGSVRLEVEQVATAVRLVVRDDGPGIPADKLDAVFERFVKVDGPNARRGGAGLGLAICKSIVAWHDGRIWAESGSGKGARFVVSLPRLRATSRARAEKPLLKERQREESRIPELLVEMISEVMRARVVSLMLLDQGGDDLFIQAAMGLPNEAIRDGRVGVGERIAGRVAKTGETILIPDLDADGRFEPSDSRQYETRSLISAPIRIRDETIGVVNVTGEASGRPFDENDRRLLELLAQRVGLILSKLRELGSSRESLDRMESAIRGVIDVRRHHHYGSSDESSTLILGVCRALGIDGEQAARIHYASILHDVGMTLLPEGVYRKPARLTERDRELVEGHPEQGAKVLRSIEFLPDVFDIILAHHEEPDGSGYPRGHKGSGIPTGAKILAVVDAYHALRSGRPYKKAVGRDEAIAELRNAAGQFDERVVQALVEALGCGDDAERTRELIHSKHEGEE